MKKRNKILNYFIGGAKYFYGSPIFVFSKFFLLIFSFVLFLWTYNQAFAQQRKVADNSTCLSCHDDPTISMTKKWERNFTRSKKIRFFEICPLWFEM